MKHSWLFVNNKSAEGKRIGKAMGILCGVQWCALVGYNHTFHL